MNHPLTRIFVPIAMIIVIAASSVAIGTTDQLGAADTDDIAMAAAIVDTGDLRARAAIEPDPNQR